MRKTPATEKTVQIKATVVGAREFGKGFGVKECVGIGVEVGVMVEVIVTAGVLVDVVDMVWFDWIRADVLLWG